MSSISEELPSTYRCFGIWVPLDLWKDKSLSPMEKMLLCEIKYLESDKEGGCWASNAHLSRILVSSEGSVNKCLTKLRKLGFVKTVAFDGRKRVIKCLHPSLMRMQQPIPNGTGGNTIRYSEPIPNGTPSPYIVNSLGNSIDTIRENCGSDYSKSLAPPEEIGRKAPSDDTKHISVRPKVRLTPKQLETLQEKHSTEDLDLMLDKLNEYKEETGKIYKSDSQAIYRWVEEWLHNEKAQKAVEAKRADRKTGDIEKNIRIYEDIRGSLEVSTKRSLLSRDDTEAFDEVRNRRCRLDDPNFGKKLYSWYGYEYTEGQYD